MSIMDDVLSAIRSSPTVSVDELCRRLGLGRDDLDAVVGYWVNRGELVIEPTCASGSCAGCPLTGGCAYPAQSRYRTTSSALKSAPNRSTNSGRKSRF
jgi:hypothetical protein